MDDNSDTAVSRSEKVMAGGPLGTNERYEHNVELECCGHVPGLGKEIENKTCNHPQVT